jgi:predicted metal-binding protein
MNEMLSMAPKSGAVTPTVITEVIVCTTCRPVGVPRDQPAHGAALFEAVQIAAWDVDPTLLANLRVRGVECMTGCNRLHCNVASARQAALLLRRFDRRH